ncbi:MAG: hypothetical protein KC609_13355, partial [Myxococcales bacterium]|nr:hypothetical protein [Myxococcales bacterium]
IRYQRYPVGSKILVAWNNSPYTAVVQRVDGDFHWIHYPGWAAYWDEWILSPRIVPTEVPTATSVVPIGTRVWVFWGKKWWRAELKKRQGERFFIHYVRFDNSWDEWVTPARIRVPKAPNAPRANHR